MLCPPVEGKKGPVFSVFLAPGLVCITCGTPFPGKVWDLNKLPSEQSRASLEFQVSINFAIVKKSVLTFSKIMFWKSDTLTWFRIWKYKSVNFSFHTSSCLSYPLCFPDTPGSQVICKMLPKIFWAYRKYITSVIAHNIFWNLHFLP